ncbi:uncharacterized protein LOC113496899 [Trichoplusia ni]|uniref:Uncharacterized protein LOC113496899 n=1 Tax=Trichoplusia ni TaxID=7111 RepID=A0A7E5VUR7_TRINI|nr:uncharacterized protein LOC113496899 [Trichoplusia ni]
MAFKFCVCLCLLQMIVFGDFTIYETIIRQPIVLDNCNMTECAPPCPGAAPPVECPANVPYCHFGCACYTNCDIGVVTCFQIRDCLEVRRFFTKRRRITNLE